MINLREFFRSTAIYSVLAFLPFASRIVLLPIYLLYIAPREFGILGLHTTLVAFISVFISLGFDNAFSRFYFEYRRKTHVLYSYMSTIILSILLFSLITLLLLNPFGDSIQGYFIEDTSFSYYPFGITAFLLAAVASINGIILTFLRNEKKPILYLYLSGGLFIFTTLGEFIGIVFFNCKAIELIWIRLIITLFLSGITWILVFFKIRLHFDYRFLKPSFYYALPILIYMFFGRIYSHYDRIMIENEFRDFTTLAIYNLAVSLSGIIENCLSAIQNATYPDIYRLFKDGYEKNTEPISKIYRIKGFILIFIITGIAAAAPPAIILFLKPVYSTAIAILPLILIIQFFRYAYVVYSEPLFFFKKTNRLPWLSVIAGVMTVVGNLILLPRIGLYGAVLTSIAANIVVGLLTYRWSVKIMRFSFNIKRILFMILICSLLLILATLAYPLLRDNHLAIYALYAAPFIFCVLFVLVLLLKNNPKNALSVENIKQIL